MPTYSTLSWGAQGRLYRAQKVLLDSPQILRTLRAEKGVAAWVALAAGLGWDASKRCILISYVLADQATVVALDDVRALVVSASRFRAVLAM